MLTVENHIRTLLLVEFGGTVSVSINIGVSSPKPVGVSFVVEGFVFTGIIPLALGPVPGASVSIFKDGVFLGGTITNSAGLYTFTTSINQAGTFGFRAETMGVTSETVFITIVAPPTPVITFTLSISSVNGGATIPPAGNYIHEAGTVVRVQAVPNTGFRFVEWSVNGAVNVEPSAIITMTSNVILVPSFALITPQDGNGGLGNLGLIVVGAIALMFLSQR